MTKPEKHLNSGDLLIFLSGLGSSVKNHTIVAAIVSVALCAIFYWWFNPSLLQLLLYGALAVVATLTVPIIYRLTGFTLADELEWLENREADEHRQMIERLQQNGKRLNDLGVKEGVQQAEMLTDILDDYHQVVETRFIGKKNSPLAYLSAARSVQKHAVQNLTDMVAVGHSISTINRNKFESATDDRKVQQSEMYDEQKSRLDGLLEENRKLFNALTDTAVEVANIKSFSNFDRIDTLGRLVSLAEIANKTGR